MCASMSESGMQVVCEEIEKKGSLYVFPGPAPISISPRVPPLNQSSPIATTITTSGLSWYKGGLGEVVGVEDEEDTEFGKRRKRPQSVKGHKRSVSHGGVLATSSTGWQTTLGSQTNSSMTGVPISTMTTSTTTTTKSAITTTTTTAASGRPSALKKPGHQRAFSQGQVVDVQGHPVTVHSRVGSKTDFILPPGHRDVPRITTARTPSYRGHSRQASRSESIYTIRRSAAPPWWRRIWAYYFGSSPEQPKLRTIIPNHLVPPKTPPKQHPNGTIDNRVRTTKYTPLTFLPRNLLEQFHRVANIYFIFIVFLNWWPEINAFGKEISIIPVMFVLGVTAIKDFFEDRRRFASDRRVNNSTCRVYCSDVNRYAKIPWKDVKVGDLIHLSNNEIVPADLLLLRSSDPQGFALLDTCNLDGETNLKQRQVVRGFLDIQDTFQPSKFRSVVEVDQPSTKIYRFYGAVVHPNGTRVPVTTENLLLRECLLKNTDFIEGIVVYAGHETKAMLNNGGPRYKRSRLERQMNLDIIWCVLILIVLCIVGAVGCKLWLSTFKTTTSVPFLPDFSNSNYEGILTFLTFVIILQVMIPLSLYVTMEMAKVGQVYHIGHDTELHDPETGRKAECRALNITEELGQIQYVFSDKTGTLTENKMIFRRCIVGGQDYAHLGEDVDIMACTRLKEDLLIGNARHRLQEFLIMLAICNTVVVNTQPHHDIMNSSGVIEEPQKNGVAPMSRYTRISESENSTPARSSTDNNNTPILEPLSVSVENSRPKISRPRLLNVPAMPSLNIGLLKKYSPNGNRSSPDERQNTSINSETTIITPPPIYEAESPDELALVYAAKAYDVKLIKRTARSAVISLPDKSTLAFEVLHVLPFDSNRKCMSIVVKYPNTDEIVLYSKGADSTVLSSLSSYDEESISHVKIRQQLHSYGRQGLRTLVMARRSLTKIEYDTWMEKHNEAELSFENRDRKIRESYSSLESHLTLLGATGIEDKLQEGVPEAMAALIDAGIVVWVLTGDKPETAVNIAYSAKLFSPAMQLLKLQAKTKSAAESLIHNFLETIENENSGGIDNDLQNNSSHSPGNINSVDRIAHRIGSPWQRPRALVVDGKTLTFILDSRSGLTAPFLKLTQNCSSVLACRATPLQKAYIVRVVKEKLGMRTLAIGDGANDVSMIQTADVGVGVSGREGTQAVMASDFAIARFPMLARLLLLHGHWCYDRLARMILYFFYKNAMFVFLIFWYQLYCGFSGGVMIDQVYLMLYNLLFTSLPPLVIGIYDRVASSKLLLESPELYSRGRLASVYKPHSFWITMADALYQSIIVFFVNEAAYYDSVVDIWEFGTTITTSCIAVMLLHAAMEFRSWTILHVLTIIGSLMIFFGFCLLYSFACVNCMGLPGSYYVMPVAMSRQVYWLTVLLASVLAVLPRFVYKTVKNTVAPDMLQQAKLRNRMKQKVMKNNIGRNMTNGENRLVANWSRSTEHATIRPRTYGGKSNVLTTIVA